MCGGRRRSGFRPPAQRLDVENSASRKGRYAKDPRPLSYWDILVSIVVDLDVLATPRRDVKIAVRGLSRVRMFRSPQIYRALSASDNRFAAGREFPLRVVGPQRGLRGGRVPR